MPTFFVTVEEIITNRETIEVEAESAEEARRLIEDGKLNPGELEPSTYEISVWGVVPK